ncbi:MAG: DUF2157 domain-containing protein [Salaquimonas sp.]
MANWAIWNRKNILSSALEDWQERGLINPAIASILQADISANVKQRSFSTIVILLGVICLAFGVMTFVAANWDSMTSQQRVGLLFISLWISWGISIWCKIRNNEWAAQVFVMLGCAIFGASIMLIGQIYHIQGEPKDAVWLWAIGTGFAALVTFSIPALVLYVGLITLWGVMDFNLFGRNNLVEYSYLAYWALGALGAWWLSSRFTAHILATALVFWLLYAVGESITWRDEIKNVLPLHIVMAASFSAIALTLYSHGSKQYLKGFEVNTLVYLFILLGGLLLIWYSVTDIRWNGKWRMVTAAYVPGMIGAAICIATAFIARQVNHAFTYDIIVTAIFASVAVALAGSATRVPFVMETFMLALSIWTIRMGWRLDYKSLSTLGFFGFAGVMLLLYFKTLGTLLDTSLFYLGAGVLLLAGAIILPKFMGRSKNAGAGS